MRNGRKGKTQINLSFNTAAVLSAWCAEGKSDGGLALALPSVPSEEQRARHGHTGVSGAASGVLVSPWQQCHFSVGQVPLYLARIYSYFISLGKNKGSFSAGI